MKCIGTHVYGVLSPSQYSQYKTFADYLCMQDNSPQPRRFAPGLWKCYSVRHFRSPSPQTSGLAELCCTVDNGNPPTGAHFTSPVCTCTGCPFASASNSNCCYSSIAVSTNWLLHTYQNSSHHTLRQGPCDRQIAT